MQTRLFCCWSRREFWLPQVAGTDEELLHADESIVHGGAPNTSMGEPNDAPPQTLHFNEIPCTNQTSIISGQWREAAQAELKCGYEKRGTTIILLKGESDKTGW